MIQPINIRPFKKKNTPTIPIILIMTDIIDIMAKKLAHDLTCPKLPFAYQFSRCL